MPLAATADDDFGRQHTMLEVEGTTVLWQHGAGDSSGPSGLSKAQLQAELREPLTARATLDEDEVDGVLQAANAMASSYDVAYGFAHAALFLHRDGYFRRVLPALCERLEAQMRRAAVVWHGAEAADALALRCVEFHTYQAGGGLLDVDHRDTGSAVSMSILLSDAAQMDGGRFVTWGASGPTAHALARGDAVLFDSEKRHNVTTVRRGVRHSLVLELWCGPRNALDRDK